MRYSVNTLKGTSSRIRNTAEAKSIPTPKVFAPHKVFLVFRPSKSIPTTLLWTPWIYRVETTRESPDSPDSLQTLSCCCCTSAAAAIRAK